AELKKVSTQNVTVQYLSCDGISHGQTKLFYKENSVVFGESCDAHQKEFKCENGVWKYGTSNADLELYKYFTCTVGPASNCETDTNTQKSTTNLDVIFNIPAIEHGIGFNVENTVNENNGTYKYTLQGTCNNGTFESIVFGVPILKSCNSGYNVQGNNCLEDTYWSGDATSGFTFTKLGQIVYPKSCNDLLVSTNTNFKIGTTLAYNGTNFIDGVYWIKPNENTQFKSYCDMSNEGGGWTMIVGFKGNVLDTSYYDNANVGWTKVNGLGTFSSNLNYNSSYFSPAYGNVNGNYLRISNGQDRLTWNLPGNNSLYYYVHGTGRVIYSAGSTTTGLTFNTDLSYRNTSNITNLSKRRGNLLKVLCQDGRSGGRDNAVLGFRSDMSHTGYYCEGFGYPNFGDHSYRYNTRWYSETVGDSIVNTSDAWRSDSKYYNIWIR
ncbi:MAG: fibrinogen-like YCDxxxxGGGW domain-containing protein, partial [Candidatus Absconditabacteria bacterium]